MVIPTKVMKGATSRIAAVVMAVERIVVMALFAFRTTDRPFQWDRESAVTGAFLRDVLQVLVSALSATDGVGS